MTTLSLARRASVAPLPLSSATTYDPTHGYLIHPHLDVAAAHVVAMGGGLEVTTEPHPKAGRPYPRPEAGVSFCLYYPATRTLVRRIGEARILSTPTGLTLAEEQAALEQARAAPKGTP